MRKVFVTAFVLILVDQLVKCWVKTNMFLGQEYLVFDWFRIHFTENNGMAFGMEFGGRIGKKLLTVFRVFVVLIGVKYLLSFRSLVFPFWASIAVGLILGGAVGNIIDSCFYGLLFNDSYNNIASFFPAGGGYDAFMHGKVVDMLYFPIINTHVNGEHFVFFRPVFNFADAGISIGIFIILLFYRKLFN